ncbi:MAG: 4'-phosphopantetheinyl transferase superfamily protein [Rickettsiella sp.]|nr:4'-phosphopantetheinyl transferase superfamily protein [Rickettsiella sp.]
MKTTCISFFFRLNFLGYKLNSISVFNKFSYYKKGHCIQATLGSAIHIWHAKLGDHINQYKLFQNWLSIEEMARAEKLSPPYCHRFVLSRGILRHLLSNYSGQSPSQIQFSYTESGKPYLMNSSLKQIEFNLSHSHDRAAFAFTLDTPIGIDLEYKITKKYIDKIAYRFFSVHDYEKIKRLTGKKKLNAFFNAWVRNEALLKALGCHLQTHPFSRHQAQNKQIKKAIIEKSNPCFIFTLSLHPDFATALAIKGSNKIITIKKYD